MGAGWIIRRVIYMTSRTDFDDEELRDILIAAEDAGLTIDDLDRLFAWPMPRMYRKFGNKMLPTWMAGMAKTKVLEAEHNDRMAEIEMGYAAIQPTGNH
jgi:hypothetical protein